MFFIFALLSAIAYSLNDTLMVSFYRKNNQLEAVVMRGIGISLTMLPLLLFVDVSSILREPNFAVLIVTAALLALVANCLAAAAFSYLPVGITSSMTVSLRTVFAALLGFFYFSETISAGQVFWIAMILCGVICLGLQKIAHAHIQYQPLKGVLTGAAFALLISIAAAIVAALSRSVSPLVVGYFWEFIITIFGVVTIFLRKVVLLKAPTSSLSDLRKIILYSFAAAIGTACYASALSAGPMAIVSAVMTSTMIFTSCFAWIIYAEKLTKAQMVCIFFILCMLSGLKLLSS